MAFTRLTDIATGNASLRLDAGVDGSLLARSDRDGDWISRFDANGSRTIINANAPGGTGQSLRFGDIDVLTGGGFVVDGTIFSGTGRGTNVQVYNALGTAVTAILTPTDEQTGNALNGLGYVVSATTNGGYALTWSEDSNSSAQLTATNGFTASEGVDVRIRYFDATGTALAPSDLAATAQAPVPDNQGVLLSRLAFNQSIYDGETLTGGGVAYVYLDTRPFTGVGGFGQDFELTLQVSSGSGSPGTPVKVDLGVIGDGNTAPFLQILDGANGANVVALANGGIAVVWQENAYVRTGPSTFAGNGYNTMIRFFDASGNAQSDAMFLFNRNVPLAQVNTYVWAEAMPDGRVALAWHEAGRPAGGGTQDRIDAFVGSVGISGVLTDVQRIAPAAANGGQFYTVRDLAVTSDGTVAVSYGLENGATALARYSTTATTAGTVYTSPGGNDVFNGTDGEDLIRGGAGNDRLFGLGGNDRIEGGAGDNVLGGGDGDDVLIALGGNDILAGGDGNDRLDGGAGSNELVGGAGNDTYVITLLTDSIVEAAGGGTDTVETTLTNYTLAAELENLTFTDLTGHNATGNAAANTIRGTTARDEFVGLGGDDTLIGGTGAANVLVGGTGNDRYLVSVAGDSIVELADEGIDTVETTLSSYALSANLENLTFVGGGAFNGAGNANANTITGGTGAAGTFVGLGGDDIYVIAVSGDSLVEAAGGGTDTVRTNLGVYALGNNLENLVYTGAGSFTGIGNGEANTIDGGALADFLSGLAGDDVLNGHGGLDYLFGGGGADRFVIDAPNTGPDRILDFTSGEDQFALLNSGFSHTATTALVQGSGTQTANSTNSTFLYDTASGELFYDADGTGSGAAVAVAILNTGLTLTVADFIFI